MMQSVVVNRRISHVLWGRRCQNRPMIKLSAGKDNSLHMHKSKPELSRVETQVQHLFFFLVKSSVTLSQITVFSHHALRMFFSTFPKKLNRNTQTSCVLLPCLQAPVSGGSAFGEWTRWEGSGGPLV